MILNRFCCFITYQLTYLKKPKKEDESKTIIAPDQPVTMGHLLQLFKQLNPNKPPKTQPASKPSQYQRN